MAKLLMEDDLNRRLVAMLQADGRMSHAELAERLGVSRPTIIDRVKRLEADGILNGYAARVSPAAVNKPTVAFVAAEDRGRHPRGHRRAPAPPPRAGAHGHHAHNGGARDPLGEVRSQPVPHRRFRQEAQEMMLVRS